DGDVAPPPMATGAAGRLTVRRRQGDVEELFEVGARSGAGRELWQNMSHAAGGVLLIPGVASSQGVLCQVEHVVAQGDDGATKHGHAQGREHSRLRLVTFDHCPGATFTPLSGSTAQCVSASPSSQLGGSPPACSHPTTTRQLLRLLAPPPPASPGTPPTARSTARGRVPNRTLPGPSVLWQRTGGGGVAPSPMVPRSTRVGIASVSAAAQSACMALALAASPRQSASGTGPAPAIQQAERCEVWYGLIRPGAGSPRRWILA